MKIYILKSATATYIHHTIFVSNEFYLAPVRDSNSFDIYSREVFKLTIEEVAEAK